MNVANGECGQQCNAAYVYQGHTGGSQSGRPRAFGAAHNTDLEYTPSHKAFTFHISTHPLPQLLPVAAAAAVFLWPSILLLLTFSMS